MTTVQRRSASLTAALAALWGALAVVAWLSLGEEEPPAPSSSSSTSAITPPEPPASSAPSAPAEQRPGAVDPATGLIIADGWELVAANCTACHSAKLVTQNRGDREHWLSMIRWMQETQNLWPLAPAVEEKILTYLSTSYGAERYSRRPPLPEHLLPPEPSDSP